MCFAFSCTDSDDPILETYQDTSIHIEDYSPLIENLMLKTNGGADILVKEITVFPFNNNFRPFFRIPSLCITNNGTAIVACENRQILGGDKGQIDIVVARSNDKNYVQWSLSRVFENNETVGRSMNPIFVIDKNGKQGKKNRILLFTCHILGEDVAAEDATKEKLDIVYKYSDDDGLTWSPEISIKDEWNTDQYEGVIPSAANGIQLDDGTFVIPTMVIKDKNYYSGIAYKKVGSKWLFSKPTVEGDNESTVYVDNDGNIILDCRTFDKIRHRYIYNLEKDEFYTLDETFTTNLNLKAEIIKYFDGYLLTFPDTETGLRENISLWKSSDGKSWSKIYQLIDYSTKMGYSNAAVCQKKVLIVYESEKGINVQMPLEDIDKIY